MEIEEFSKVTDKGYSFRRVFQIYDNQFETIRNFLLSLGDKYIVEDIEPGTSSEILLRNRYASGQLFLYLNNVLQWKGKDYEEVSSNSLRILFERTVHDALKVIIIKSNVLQSSMESYLSRLDKMYQESKEAYDKAELIRSTLDEFYTSLEQKRELYTNDNVEAVVSLSLSARNDASSALREVNEIDNHLCWKSI